MGVSVFGVRGDLLCWARNQQGLTLRDVHICAGVAIGYQSEVETGKKNEVRAEKLGPWINCLKVTEAFARGELSRYTEKPSRCKGLAGDVGDDVRQHWHEWTRLEVSERGRRLLDRMAFRSENLTPVVLAWVLHTDLKTLNALISRELPLSAFHVQAITHLTALPAEFLGRSDPGALPPDTNPFLPAIWKALRRGMSPQQLERWIEEFPGDLPDAANDEQAPPDEPPGQ